MGLAWGPSGPSLEPERRRERIPGRNGGSVWPRRGAAARAFGPGAEWRRERLSRGGTDAETYSDRNVTFGSGAAACVTKRFGASPYVTDDGSECPRVTLRLPDHQTPSTRGTQAQWLREDRAARCASSAVARVVQLARQARHESSSVHTRAPHRGTRASGCTISIPNRSYAAAGKRRTFDVAIAWASSEATAAASTWPSPGVVGHDGLERHDRALGDRGVLERTPHTGRDCYGAHHCQ